MTNGCAEKFCKACLNKIPEKDREAFMQKLREKFQSMPEGHESCCRGPVNGKTTK